MIKKLQLKFILLSMSALFLVLVTIITSINIVYYTNIIKNANLVLAILSENEGAFPLDNMNIDFELPSDMSVEIPYESRYFYVLLDGDSGSPIQTEISHIVSVNSTTAIDYAQQAMNKNNTQGFVDYYRYIKNTENGVVRIIFLDCGRQIIFFQKFLFASVCISLIGYILVLTLISVFSNRIVRPISESYEKQKRFITDAGHEIKTPLTIINADIDVLEMELGENEWLEDIQKQAKRLATLTNDLIYLARMEESEKSMQMIEFPFSDVVSEAVSSFHGLAQMQNKQFQYEIQPMLSMQGNEKAIHQLVTILLDNALKYSPDNGKVSLTLEKQNKILRLSVFNTTENDIPKENLNLLFERFYRIDSSHNSQTGGYGIGLSIAKAIVAAHNGKIQACTQDGHSLQVTVLFPL